MALNLKALLPLDHVITVAPIEKKNEIDLNARSDDEAQSFCCLEERREKKQQAEFKRGGLKRRLWIWGIY